MTSKTTIQTLPVELLIKILQTLIDGPITIYTDSLSIVPFELSQVCTTWRNVVLSTPSLWHRISYPYGFPADMPLEYMAKCVHLMLQRSRSYPLVIDYSYHYQDIDGGIELMKSLLEHVDRWETVECLELFMDEEEEEGVIANLHAPRLRQLNGELYTGKTLIEMNLNDLEFPFTFCPSLKHLTWPCPLEVDKHPFIPWNQLTSLKLDYLSSADVLQLLIACPQLVIAEFIPSDSIYVARPKVQRLYPPIVRHNLRNLEIIHESNGYGGLFGSLLFPALSNLSLLGYAALGPMQDALERSGCALRTLKLNAGDELVNVLQSKSCFSLTKLDVICSSNIGLCHKVGDAFLEAVTIDPSSMSDILCPDLEELSLQCVDHTTDGMLGRMVESRFKYGRCFKSFKIGRSRVPQGEDLMLFESLQKLGYDIDLNSY